MKDCNPNEGLRGIVSAAAAVTPAELAPLDGLCTPQAASAQLRSCCLHHRARRVTPCTKIFSCHEATATAGWDCVTTADLQLSAARLRVVDSMLVPMVPMVKSMQSATCCDVKAPSWPVNRCVQPRKHKGKAHVFAWELLTSRQ